MVLMSLCESHRPIQDYTGMLLIIHDVPEFFLSVINMIVARFDQHPLRHRFPPFAGYRVVESGKYYGKGYQDVQHRRPSIENAGRVLSWKPSITTEESVARTVDWFIEDHVRSIGADCTSPAGTPSGA